MPPTVLSFFLSICACLQLLLQVHALKGDSGCGRYVCVNVNLVEDMLNYEMTVPMARQRPAGWAAIGFGHRMKDSHMVIMWHNDDGSTTISQRYTKGHVEPMMVSAPPRMASVTEPRMSAWHPANTTSFAFQIPLNKTHHHPGSNETAEDHIWAFSISPSPNTRDPSVHIGQHFAAGLMSLDFTKDLPDADLNSGSSSMPPSIETDASNNKVTIHLSPHERAIIAHGVLVSVGFLVLLPLGSLVARWGRTVTPSWFKAHRIFNFYIALPVILVGWLLGPIAVFDAEAEHFLDAHQICGFVMLFLYLAQVFLGRYIHARRGLPKKYLHPPSNILHAGFGILLIVLAFFQVRSGLSKWANSLGRFAIAHWCHTLWNAWAVILPTLYLAGLLLLCRQFHQERNGLSPGLPANYIALSASSGSPETSQLVFDADNVAMYGESGGLFQLGDHSMASLHDSLHDKEEVDLAVPLLHKQQE